MASGQLGPQMIPLLGVSGLAVVPPGKLASHHDCRRWFCRRRRRHRRQFCQTLSVNADPLDLFDQSLLLDMIFLSTPQLRGGVNIFFFYKVSFEKHPNHHICQMLPNIKLENFHSYWTKLQIFLKVIFPCYAIKMTKQKGQIQWPWNHSMDETLPWVLTSLKQEERTLTSERREELLYSNTLSHSSEIFTK